MKGQSQIKDVVQVVIGGLSLLALLSYTLVHTGGLLSSYVQPGIVGYLAAFGIELSIVGLSLRIGDLRKSGQDVRFFVGVLVAVVSVSAMANVAEGFRVSEGVKLTLATVTRLDIIQAAIGLSATGLISLIVFALAEIVGTDVNTVVKQAEKASKQDKGQPSKPVTQFDVDTLLGAFGVNRDDALRLVKQYSLTPDAAYSYLRGKLPEGMTKDQFTKLFNELTGRVSNTVTLDAKPDALTQARAVKADSDAATKQAALDMICATLTANPDTAVTELARLVGKSRQTVYGYLSELETSGRLRRNGHTEIVQAA